jgi:Protein of unknown function (DUF2961)
VACAATIRRKSFRVRALLFAATSAFAVIAASAAETVSLESLLKEMVDTEAIARWPAPDFTCKQASSYDRAKIAPDKPSWFANHDNTQYIRSEANEGRQEQVMMDADGPGALVRFWLTAGGPKNGVMRIYLDGAATSAVTFAEFDLLKGDLKIGAPLAQAHPGNRGNNLYLPIPYAKHCKVTWEEKSKGARYYQINYRTYAPGTEVKTFALPQVEVASNLIDEVNRKLNSPAPFTGGKAFSLNSRLAAGAEASLDLPAGANAVRGLELLLKTGDAKEGERTLRSLIVKLTFDGEETVWCLATDFFGSGVGINELRSWYRDVSTDGTMRCRWVMPYEKSASVTLQNVGTQSVKATLHATTAPWKWDDYSMHFHAAWHYEAGLKTPPYRDWNFIRISGRGVYAGDSLAIYNPVATWYGEGDEKIWVDGESFPSHLGTGTEDYYNYSYAPKPVHQTPFANLVREDQPMTQGWNVMSRTRNLDGIPFQQSLQFDLELISWKPTTLIYCATTYWYAFPGATSNLTPQPREAALPVPTLADARAQALAAMPHKPGASECEVLKILNKSDNLRTTSQDMSPWDAEKWSGGHQLTVFARKVGDFVELEVPAPDANARQIVLHATQAPDYGILKSTVNGQPVAATLDGYAPKVQPAAPLRLGIFTPENGKFILRAEVTGANPQAVGAKYLFGLDCVILENP